ncbi:unnamed protein product [Schistosoma margrebowiei]|uniref:Ubiquitin-like domain-containing protein n=1 Tax=Schistosoma margrebowiei TaxID=48269 RepID=A0AA85ALB9_9TREM|nr:unnamed protein product [Schistosoma margrebowiei]
MTPRRTTARNEFRVFISSSLELCYCVEGISPASVVKDVIKEAELCFGISNDLMHVNFIDRGDLIDSSSLMESNIVNGSTLHVTTSKSLEALFKSIITSDMNLIIQNSLSKFFPYPSGPFISMTTKYQHDYIASRLNAALLFASGMGLANVCNTLICLGANVNAKTKFGRTPLHIAAAHFSSGEIITDLVNRADIKMKDIFGETALDIARRYVGYKDVNLQNHNIRIYRCVLFKCVIQRIRNGVEILMVKFIYKNLHQEVNILDQD